MSDWLFHQWSALDDATQRATHGLALIISLYAFHFTLFSYWYIEDAAISFAFARNAAEGLGFVAYAGGEPVEGFSNPTWTLLLMSLEYIGLTPWIAAKALGLLFGALTLPITWAYAHKITPDQRALIAPLLLALSPQFVLWNASGLENALFNLLLAGGALLLLREAEHPARLPWSGILFGLLAITRPEAPLYGAVAALITGLAILHSSGPRAFLRWAASWTALFALPFFSWHLWRFNYFSWEFPNTYYAKLGETDRFQPLKWDLRGWRYLRAYSLNTGHGLLIPLYLVGQSGLKGVRARFGLGVIFVGTTLILPGLTLFEPWMGHSEPAALVNARLLFIALVALAFPLIGLTRSLPRLLAWYLGLTTLFFVLYSGGDWMKAFRWLSLCSVPSAILLGDAIGQLHLAQWPRVQRLAPRGVLLFVVLSSVLRTGVFLNRSETTPFDVHRRVRYMQQVQARLHLDHVSLAEVDMGAHMWWSGFDLIDYAGLVDVPFGHNHFDPQFVTQYLFNERRPEFIHAHGGWGKRSGFFKREAWRDYVEIPGFPHSRSRLHIGNHVRRDLLFRPATPEDDMLAIDLSIKGDAHSSARLLRAALPSPETYPGGVLYIEVDLQRIRPTDDFRVWIFLSDGAQVRWSSELAPAYDWVLPRLWKTSEVAIGRYSLALPATLPLGDYSVGLVISGPGGVLLPASPRQRPVFSVGEIILNQRVSVLTREALRALVSAEGERLEQATKASHCDEAIAHRRRMSRPFPPDNPWIRSQRRPRLIGRCLAQTLPNSPVTAASQLKDALRLAPSDPIVQAEAADFSAKQVRRGEEAFNQERLHLAYEAWTLALQAQPTQTHLRRRVETLRLQLKTRKTP